MGCLLSFIGWLMGSAYTETKPKLKNKRKKNKQNLYYERELYEHYPISNSSNNYIYDPEYVHKPTLNEWIKYGPASSLLYSEYDNIHYPWNLIPKPVKNLNAKNKKLKRNSSLSKRQANNSSKSKKGKNKNKSQKNSSCPVFITFILSHSSSKPLLAQNVIPDSFQSGNSYRDYFQPAFYIESDAILDQALKGAFLSRKYQLYLNMAQNCEIAYTSSPSDIEFKKEVIVNDILMIVPYQNEFPASFEEIEEMNIQWTLGWVDNIGKEKINIFLNPNREIDFLSSREYTTAVIGNFTSIRRENNVINKLKHFPLHKKIYCPKVYQQFNESEIASEIISRLKEISGFNTSQIIAIYNSINSKGEISLIQRTSDTGNATAVAEILSELYKIKTNMRVLVCAKNNAIVDEIASKVLKNDFFDLNGNARHDISLLKVWEKSEKNELGFEEDEAYTPKTIKKSIRSINIDTSVEIKLKSDEACQQIYETTRIRELEAKTRELKKRQKYNYELKALKRANNKYFSKKCKSKKCIRVADVIFCTLSGSGSPIVRKSIGHIDYLIIAEAFQSLELNTLIPFQCNPENVILIGDPEQQPAPTFSEISKYNKYNRSLFERMMDCNIRPIPLCQYCRILKEISYLSNQTFDQNKIQLDKSILYPQLLNLIKPEGLCFFNLETSEEVRAEDEWSYFNDSEANFVLEFYALLSERIYDMNVQIGIISPYKGQLKYIENLLYEWYDDSWKKNCEVSTIEKIKGKELDLVILSTVKSESIGLLKDERRMNEAISKAKYGAYIIGNEACLLRDSWWRSLIEHCQELGKYQSFSSFEDAYKFFE